MSGGWRCHCKRPGHITVPVYFYTPLTPNRHSLHKVETRTWQTNLLIITHTYVPSTVYTRSPDLIDAFCLAVSTPLTLSPVHKQTLYFVWRTNLSVSHRKHNLPFALLPQPPPLPVLGVLLLLPLQAVLRCLGWALFSTLRFLNKVDRNHTTFSEVSTLIGIILPITAALESAE